MKIFSIDPSTVSCGFAVSDGDEMLERGLFTAESTVAPFDRCSSIAKAIFYTASYHQPDRVVCEYPHKSGPGMKTKRITILFHLCGMIHSLMNHIDVPIEFVEPIKWKGNQPKEAHHPKIIRNAKNIYGIDVSKDTGDTIDAIGLVIWYAKLHTPL